ncbi:membrane protein [Paraliobacillus quinghaiensis]|uniref:Membrane protein n=1 Tax=Paraliobacillus quinghaiensis TaxID=470815 RepID=A0A917TWT8_9BACI|nr:YitT family protein [Paraliobacillus quinghaiensis]GGM41845.1 membrane protein [Paraliobacillus quinghaiensis]
MEKIIKVFLGIIIVSIGVLTLKHAELITGGTAGLALNLSYLFSQPFSLIFFLVNIPFYIFSILRMGWKFTLTTIVSVSLLSILTGLDVFLPNFTVSIWIGAIIGGAFIGFGLSILFANGSSLGGSNILALFFHKRYQFNPGTTNFLFDIVVVTTGIYTVGIVRGLASVLSIAVISVIVSHFKSRITEKETEIQKTKKTATINARKVPTN